jgi:hypothetical protein
VNEANNVWTSEKGKVEEDVILDGFLGTYTSTKAPVKFVITEKNGALNVEITNYPKFNLTPIGKNKFESKRAGLQLEFNEAQTGFDMILADGRKIPFAKQ